MKLSDFIKKKNLRVSEVARQLGIPYEYVRRYLLGTIPSRKKMNRIVEWSCGEVSPNDFYEEPKER